MGGLSFSKSIYNEYKIYYIIRNHYEDRMTILNSIILFACLVPFAMIFAIVFARTSTKPRNSYNDYGSRNEDYHEVPHSKRVIIDYKIKGK